MKLYLVRHGIAEDPHFSQADSDRRLTGEGIAKMHSIGKSLAQLQPDIQIIISSPYVRARQTAEIIAEELSFKNDILFDKRIIPSGDFTGFAEMLSELSGEGNSLFVGHEPSMSSFVSGLCADHSLRIDFKKGAICCVDIFNVRSARGVLQWYAPPKVMIR